MTVYGPLSTYGPPTTYGVGELPASTEHNVFDFCHPTDATMLSFFSYPIVTPSLINPPYVYFNGDNDLCMFSDNLTDSGFRIDLPITPNFTYEVTILPTLLPADFSDLVNHRFFSAVYNQYQNMIGLLISEHDGIALAKTGTDTGYELIPDSSDFFDEGLTYYTIRVVSDFDNSRGHLYVTRQDLVSHIGHQLRYSFPMQLTPAGVTDHVVTEVVGSAGDPTHICLDCIRLSDYANMANQRPIAVPGDDKTRLVGQYASFDGSESYDPDGDVIQKYWWTITYAPVNSDLRLEGLCDTDANTDGRTTRVTGAAGLFSEVSWGDLFSIDGQKSPVVYLSADGSELVVKDQVLTAGVTDASWLVIKQTTWAGNEVPIGYSLVQSSDTDPSPLSGSGTGDSIAFSVDTCTLTDSAGLFTADMLGSPITIAGASDSDNNGTFTVTAYTSPTEVSYSNPVGAAEVTFTGTWSVVPVSMNMYRVLPSAVGDWLNHDNELAVWGGSSWVFYNPGDLGSESLLIYDIEASLVYRWNSLGEPLVADGLWYEDEPNFWELGHWDGRAAVVGSMLTDHHGLHIIDLIVNDGDLNSIPVEVVLNVTLTDVQLGLIPDLSFVWDYLPDFWELVPDRDKFDTIWSAMAQIVSSDLLALWQYDYSKSLRDIQRLFQRQWLAYDILYEEPNYFELPATILNATNESGWSATPNVQVEDPLDPPNLIDSTTAYDLGATVSGLDDTHVLVLDGVAYPIARVQEDTNTIVVTKDTLPTGADRSKAWMIRPSVESQSSDFTLVGVSPGDQAVFKVLKDSEETSAVGYVWGVRGSILVFDDTDLAAHISDPDSSVFFFGVLRRSSMQVDDLVVSIPRLQEVINLRKITDAPAPLDEEKDYRLDDHTTILNQDIRRIEFLDAWFPQDQFGFEAQYPAENQFGVNPSPLSGTAPDFEALYGVGADMTGYVLELTEGTFRLRQVVDSTTLELFDESLEVYTAAYDKGWKIRAIEDPPDTMWAEITYLDNREIIEANFGRLVGFELDDLAARTDNLDYLSAVQGLWYSFWFGPTPNNIRNGAQILLGLPFAEESGTVADIASPYDGTRDRILVRDIADPAVYRTYYYPTSIGIAVSRETGSDLVVGDTVEQFDPLSKGVVIEDWVSTPDWINTYAGSGDLDAPQKIHNFIVRVNSDVADLTNLLFMFDFVLRIKPKYTYPFFVVLKEINEIIDMADPISVGPVIPEEGQYPDTWPIFSPPIGWSAPGPSESNAYSDLLVPAQINRVTPPTYDITTTWPDDRFVTPVTQNLANPIGNLHIHEASGRVPDGWTGDWGGLPATHSPTRTQGARKYDDLDLSGHVIHRYDAYLTTNSASGSGNALDKVTSGGSYTGTRLTNFSGPMATWMTGGSITIAGATNPDHNGTFTVTSYISANTIQYFNPNEPEAEISFSGTWEVVDDQLDNISDYLLARDGHMEESLVTPTYWAQVGTPATFEKDTSIRYTGSRSLHIVSTAGNEGASNQFGASGSNDTPTIHTVPSGFTGGGDPGRQAAVVGRLYIESGLVILRLRDQDGTTYIAEVRRSLLKKQWDQFVLHAWTFSGAAAPLQFEALAGPAGADFYLDAVECFIDAVPWSQAGYDRSFYGRTGWYSLGGDPDESFQIAIHAAVP